MLKKYLTAFIVAAILFVLAEAEKKKDFTSQCKNLQLKKAKLDQKLLQLDSKNERLNKKSNSEDKQHCSLGDDKSLSSLGTVLVKVKGFEIQDSEKECKPNGPDECIGDLNYGPINPIIIDSTGVYIDASTVTDGVYVDYDKNHRQLQDNQCKLAPYETISESDPQQAAFCNFIAQKEGAFQGQGTIHNGNCYWCLEQNFFLIGTGMGGDMEWYCQGNGCNISYD